MITALVPETRISVSNLIRIKSHRLAIGNRHMPQIHAHVAPTQAGRDVSRKFLYAKFCTQFLTTPTTPQHYRYCCLGCYYGFPSANTNIRKTGIAPVQKILLSRKAVLCTS
jgi:hypothetical protein